MKTAEKKQLLVKVGSAEVDMQEIPPLTLGDRVALKTQGVDFLKLRDGTPLGPEEEAKFILHILKKRRPETTLEEVYGLPALICSSLQRFFMEKSAEVDDPFSTRSTSSATPTGGEQPKSEPSAPAS